MRAPFIARGVTQKAAPRGGGRAVRWSCSFQPRADSSLAASRHSPGVVDNPRGYSARFRPQRAAIAIVSVADDERDRATRTEHRLILQCAFSATRARLERHAKRNHRGPGPSQPARDSSDERDSTLHTQSDVGGLGVAAEDLLQRGHDLADRRVGAHRLEDRRHEVGVGDARGLGDLG